MTRSSVCLFLFVFVAAPALAQSYEVVIEAGDYDRRQTPVRFALPEGLPAASAYHLVDGSDHGLPVQVEGDHAWAIVPELAAGATATYHLRPAAIPAAERATARSDGAEVHVQREGEPVFRYRFAPEPPPPGVEEVYTRGAFVHPVYAPSGAVLTDSYPSNHTHHHGIWAAWTRTEFDGRAPDFWNMAAETGTVEPVALDAVWSGPVQAGLTARHQYIDLTTGTPVPALDEEWTLRAYAVGGAERPVHVFDLDVEQKTAGDVALVLPEYRYGGVGFRGRWEWNGAENTNFLTSEGLGRLDGHATRARWSHVGGLVNGRPAGVAILGHPDNFEAPQPMRIHPSEPFFNYAPSQAGDWAIRPSETYRARYRFVTYDGEPDPALLDRLWNDYAHPPTVTVRATR